MFCVGIHFCQIIITEYKGTFRLNAKLSPLFVWIWLQDCLCSNWHRQPSTLILQKLAFLHTADTDIYQKTPTFDEIFTHFLLLCLLSVLWSFTFATFAADSTAASPEFMQMSKVLSFLFRLCLCIDLISMYCGQCMKYLSIFGGSLSPDRCSIPI